MLISKKKIQIMTKIQPKYFNDPEAEINKRLSSFLFKYTYKLSGIPLCYKIVGIFPVGNIICDNDCVFLKTIVEFDLLSFKIGDTIKSEDGVVFGIVYAKVNGGDSYSGEFTVKDVDNTNGECSTILGVTG